MSDQTPLSLNLVFELRHRATPADFSCKRLRVPDLIVARETAADVATITLHLNQHLHLGERERHCLVLKAVCSPSYLPQLSVSLRPSDPYIIPLVCDQVWSWLLTSYKYERLKVVVERRLTINVAAARCQARSFFLKKELKFIDAQKFFPPKLCSSDIKRLATAIFERGVRIKPELRKGVWPHLVGVFHPSLQCHEEREQYLSKLRLIYDSLKGRLDVRNGERSEHVQQLYESIRRDAVRTDPSESFYLQRQQRGITESGGGSSLSEENIEKLVNITAIFTLEHGAVSYTQGMTDLLSPILYVMEREADAYIVFAAMLQRIAENFGAWCEGTLKKVERLRHLCAVLDPQLFAHLSKLTEDAFALFFGMVLIECRREFAFSKSFHLMEVIWAAKLCMQQTEDPNWRPPLHMFSPTHRHGVQTFSPEQETSSPTTLTEWASFMTDRSPDVISQVFGDVQTYYAVPLLHNDRSRTFSHNPLIDSLTSPEPVLAQIERIESHPEDCDSSQSVTATPQPHEKPDNIMVTGSQQSCPDSSSYGLPECTLTCTEEKSGRVPSAAPDEAVNSSECKERAQSEPTFHHKACSLSEAVKIEDCRTNGEKRDEEEQKKRLMLSPSRSESELSVSPSRPPPDFLSASKSRQTEMSDMSSVSTSTSNSQGLLTSIQFTTSHNSLSATKNVENDEGEGKKGVCHPSDMEPRKDNIRAAGKNINGHENDNSLVNMSLSKAIDSKLDACFPNGAVPSHPNSILLSRNNAEESTPITNTSCLIKDSLAIKPCDGTEEDRSGLSASDIHDSLHSNHFKVCRTYDPPNSTRSENLVSQSSTLLQSSTASKCSQFQESFSPQPAPNIEDPFSKSPRDSLLTEDCTGGRSPIRPFFDTLESIASLSAVASPTESGEEKPASESGLSAVLSNLLSQERSAPSVTQKSSLTVPFSDSFPLFVCLSIILQHRVEIIRDRLDFIGLSVLLSAQAGTQNLDLTLYIARQLYHTYTHYQRMCFGPRFTVYEVWLDHIGLSSAQNDTHGEERQTAG